MQLTLADPGVICSPGQAAKARLPGLASEVRSAFSEIDHVWPAGRDLASDFSRYVNEASITGVSDGRAPTPFMSPTTVIASQLNALQRNDYPELDAGASVAFAFTKPEGAEAMLPGGVGV